MTSSHPLVDSDRRFGERLEILARELELSAQWRRPAFLMALCESEESRVAAAAALERHLEKHNEEVVHVSLNENLDPRALSDPRFPPDSGGLVHFLDGFDAFGDDGESLKRLAAYLDLVNERNMRIVLWLDPNGAARLAHRCPDIWISFQRVVEFDWLPHPAQPTPCTPGPSHGLNDEPGMYPEDGMLPSPLEEEFMNLAQAESPNLVGANLLLKLGLLYWRKEDFEKAVHTLESALQTAGRLQNTQLEAGCYNAIALVNSSMGRYEEALEAYRQAARLTPDQPAPWNQIGKLCLKVQRKDEAVIAFQKAIEHNPADPIAWIGLGKVYGQIGYVDDAIQAYQKAIRFAPSYSQPWEELASLHAALGRVEDAIQAYQKSIQLNRRNLKPRLELARLLNGNQRYQEAIKAYRHTLEIAPNNGPLWNELGQTYLDLGDLQNAAFHFSKAIELDPRLGRAYSNLALTYNLVGQHQEAVAYHVRGIELASNSEERAEYWNRLADTYRQLGQYDQAVAAYQKADHLIHPNHTNDSPIAIQKPDARRGGEERPENQPLPLLDGKPLAGQSPSDGQPARRNAPHRMDHPSPESSSSKTPNADAFIHPQDTELDRGEVPMPFTFLGFTTNAGAVQPDPQTQPPTSGAVQKRGAHDDSPEAKAWNERGNQHMLAGAYEAAISAYQKAIELAPSFGKPYYNIAFACLKLGRLDDALVHYMQAIELLDSNREKALGWSGIGFIYRCRRDYHHAMTAYQKADELDPENAAHRENVEHLPTEPGPQNTQVWTELGAMFLKSGKYRDAARAYQQAAALSPNSGACLSNLAASLMFLGKYREAAQYYQKSIPLFQQKKDKAEAWNRLGDAYRKLNEHDQAISAYQTALKLTNEPINLLTRARFSLLSNCRATGPSVARNGEKYE